MEGSGDRKERPRHILEIQAEMPVGASVQISTHMHHLITDTPRKKERPHELLNTYHNKEDELLLIEGFMEGFRIPIEKEIILGPTRNLKSAVEHPWVVDQKVQKGKQLGRIEGPLEKPPLQNLVISSLGVVPKEEPSQYLLIHHCFSFLEGNDAIKQDLCSVN
ncbi:hypothetical protein NDU88_005613 [Pleurodeles waltl]|uniref:Uncharacterized protein n=1 Tax=Pleurodeles waltl TaxID=8319 RepID=A0AAV7W8J8_PLEWA|nr:hypothetical protein NDU88_005613 [Pleurodeles waltl]